MQPATRTFGSTPRFQRGEIFDQYLAARTSRRIPPDSDVATVSSATGRGADAQETMRSVAERLGYWRPSEADLTRQYAGRCYADDSRGDRDRCVGARAMPAPNFGGSLTGNAAAMCCSA